MLCTHTKLWITTYVFLWVFFWFNNKFLWNMLGYRNCIKTKWSQLCNDSCDMYINVGLLLYICYTCQCTVNINMITVTWIVVVFSVMSYKVPTTCGGWDGISTFRRHILFSKKQLRMAHYTSEYNKDVAELVFLNVLCKKSCNEVILWLFSDKHT